MQRSSSTFVISLIDRRRVNPPEAAVTHTTQIVQNVAIMADEMASSIQEISRATEEINQKVDAIQSNTRTAMEALGGIGTVISQNHETQTAIADAVEEQTATTWEMGRNLAEAARRTSEISDIVNEAASAAQSTSTGASSAEDAAAELANMAQELKTLLAQFRY